MTRLHGKGRCVNSDDEAAILDEAQERLQEAAQRSRLVRDTLLDRHREPLKDTTKDRDHEEDEDRAENEQPGDHEKNPVSSSRRRSAGPSSFPPPVSSTAGRPAIVHTAPALRAAQLVSHMSSRPTHYTFDELTLAHLYDDI